MYDPARTTETRRLENLGADPERELTDWWPPIHDEAAAFNFTKLEQAMTRVFGKLERGREREKWRE